VQAMVSMITIVTPTLNAATVLGRNLNLMANQQADFEHIIQDGGSTDDTAELVASYASRYNVKFFQERDSGIYDGVLRGMARARGDILAWLGADDLYMPWTLSTVEHVFARHPEVDWIIGLPALGFHNNQIVKVVPLAPVYLQSFIRWGWYRPGQLGVLQQESMFWRRNLWEASQPSAFLSNYKISGDYHLWRAFARHSRLWTVSTVLAAFSTSPNQSSNKHLSTCLAECGARAQAVEPAWWGKFVNRAISLVANYRVLRPEAGLLR
jgi:cellulose synthase/poly-beta-1,6-N-acetylglucosamine synthase-like glycosyltransferase